MCGIAGIISLDGSEIRNGSLRVQNMLKNMEHRGPDGEGIYINKTQKVILGNNRLAITDPNYQINGPLALENEEMIMSFNGEIYDYLEQRNNLIQEGAVLKSRTDTEVLMQGIKKEGIDFLSKVDGCWAFALLDNKKKKLTISRDLLGEKQIFFLKTKKEFIFSSEAFSLLSAITENPEINLIELITSIRYFSSSVGRTLFNQVKKFKPGQTLVFNLSNNVQIEEKYPVKLNPHKWLNFFQSKPSDEVVIEKLSELLFSSVRNRLARDVSFFTTLSGGIDSNLMTYFASLEKKNIDTIFIQTSKELDRSKEELNEQEASRFTSKLLKTNHHEVFVEAKKTSESLRQNAVNSIDGLLDWGTVSFELIGNAVKKQNFKAILVSEGADELCGYEADQINFTKYNKLKDNSKLLSPLNYLNRNILLRKIIRRVKPLSNYIIEPYCSLNPFVFKPHHEAMGHDYLSKFFTRSIVNLTNEKYGIINSEYCDSLEKLDISQKISLSYMNYSIPDFSNLRIDKGFMKTSVEPRCPFLNLELVNFLLAMPSVYKFRNGFSKFILRKMVEKYIGPEIAWRKKHGFSYPIWSRKNVKDQLRVKDNILNSEIIKKLPWSKNGKNYFEKNIYSKFAWPLYALSQIEKKYNIKNTNLK